MLEKILPYPLPFYNGLYGQHVLRLITRKDMMGVGGPYKDHKKDNKKGLQCFKTILIHGFIIAKKGGRR